MTEPAPPEEEGQDNGGRGNGGRGVGCGVVGITTLTGAFSAGALAGEAGAAVGQLVAGVVNTISPGTADQNIAEQGRFLGWGIGGLVGAAGGAGVSAQIMNAWNNYQHERNKRRGK